VPDGPACPCGGAGPPTAVRAGPDRARPAVPRASVLASGVAGVLSRRRGRCPAGLPAVREGEQGHSAARARGTGPGPEALAARAC